MNGLALLGLFLILYSIVVVVLAIKKPKSIWEMDKIKFFIKLLIGKLIIPVWPTLLRGRFSLSAPRWRLR